MRFVKYSLKEYGRTVDYVAFGDDKFWMRFIRSFRTAWGWRLLKCRRERICLRSLSLILPS